MSAEEIISQLPFIGKTSSALKPKVGPASVIVALVILVAAILLMAVISRWLWNKALVPSVTIAKPVKSIWTMLGIIVLLGILIPRR